jgi:aryl-alcohol dehydrogenase-like predicted oxidoreductase
MSANNATREGTEGYKNRNKGILPQDHFRVAQNWWMSSLGLGTYLGDPDAETDQAYTESIVAAINLGCNVIDAAINYRFQRSERSIAKALSTLMGQGAISRNEIVLSSKGGFLSFDGEYPPNPASYFQKEYFDAGILSKEDVVAGCHCMSPAYLENQLDRSLKNLNVDCIDIYFVHNPETQLSEISRQEFLKRILATFKMLEKKVSEGKIQIYGVATWDGFRVAPDSKSYISLEELIGLARNAGGEDHHFLAIQLPFNLAMPEAFVSRNQKFGSQSVSTLEAARLQNMIVLASASILQGRLSADLPEFVVEFFKELPTDAMRSLQFVRSTPGVTSALVGMSQKRHVEENLLLAKHSPLTWDILQGFFK